MVLALVVAVMDEPGRRWLSGTGSAADSASPAPSSAASSESSTVATPASESAAPSQGEETGRDTQRDRGGYWYEPGLGTGGGNPSSPYVGGLFY